MKRTLRSILSKFLIISFAVVGFMMLYPLNAHADDLVLESVTIDGPDYLLPGNEATYTFTCTFNKNALDNKDLIYSKFHTSKSGSGFGMMTTSERFDGNKLIYSETVKLSDSSSDSEGFLRAIWDIEEKASKNISFKAPLTITAKDKTYQYNGQIQGPGDIVYDAPAQIAEMVSVTGLQGSDYIAQIEVEGQGGPAIGTYPDVLVPVSVVIKGANGNDVTGNYVITYVRGNIILKAIIENKSGSEPSTNDNNSDNNSGSQPQDEESPDYLDELRTELTTAIRKGGEQTVYWNKGTSLTYDIMKILEDNPKITLVFSYTYQGKNYKATIHGSNVKTDPKIPFYGPLYLNGYFGENASANANIKPMETGAVYTVKKGDTLGVIARRLNTTVDYLVKVNNIADRNKIREGQILKY